MREKSTASLLNHQQQSHTPGNSARKESDLNIEAQRKGCLPHGTFTAAKPGSISRGHSLPGLRGAEVTLTLGEGKWRPQASVEQGYTGQADGSLDPNESYDFANLRFVSKRN